MTISVGTSKVGSLVHKSTFEEGRNLDWAVCALDYSQVLITNQTILENGSKLFTSQIVEELPTDAAVFVQAGGKSIKGYILGDYSLVALPGSKSFQRMWVVILERDIGTCDLFV
jgi:hypothetical protein